MNVTAHVEMDTENPKATKDVIKALHRHFHGLLDPNTQSVINQLNDNKLDTSAKSHLDVVYDLEQ